jgi:Flp pilus assembly protein TadB
MSKERARRRAEREAAAALERERRARERARQARVRAVRDRLTGFLRRPAEPDSALVRQHRRQNGVLLAGIVAVNAVLWLLATSWLWRGAVVVLSVLAWPLLVVLCFDRRSTR